MTTDFAGGSGTASSPYEIETWNHLDNVRSNYGDHFVLIDDLDDETAGYDDHASENANGGDGWNPIGSSSSAFDLTLDGDGYTISDLFVSRTGTGDDHIGLFAFLGDAEVTNLGVVTLGVTGKNKVGAIAGMSNGAITNCFARGTVEAKEQYQSTFAGGLVGDLRGTITESYATGDVTGDSTIGGLAGYNSGEITESYAAGVAYGSYAVGGLVGENDGDVVDTYYNSQNTEGIGEANGDTNDATGLSSSEMQGDAAETNMTAFDFQHTWTTVDGDYPTFQLDGGGEPDPLSVSVDGDSIGVGGDAAISIDAASVAEITVSDLWTDWEITDVADEGGTVTDEIDTAGTYTIDWSSQQGSVSPAITVSPPDRYVGGEYAIVVTATDGEDTVDATATLQID